ncbi:2-oxo-4-hydroxy-4-carboxy-5-ureidoimidazoline decarboxylase [Chthonobacter rhizosphaerae]|uniref:2-oxo-4-hydroxy-4-carboxy-5-ureidoimidazoline decarboxylase n=1 Tax=Chthonobacter rhizosphaerae TaxID=2735553 RepID=UPI0015EF53A3|nr:2-oxo-4-hydroxy-4-carboxy-5-ureidoimidazoline decarboxylase [Chthonobacter rhizosphaerae]
MTAAFPIALSAVNALDDEAFLARFGDVAEHSPWVAAGAAARRPFADREAMVAAFAAVVDEADRDARLALLRAHPDLAGRAALAGAIAEDSRREQKGAGLDTLTPDEYARFTALNDRYRARFGFPFIFAVKGATKHMILDAFEARVGNDVEVEFDTALAQVARIFRFRLEDRVTDGEPRP